jgi:hypothetical protein
MPVQFDHTPMALQFRGTGSTYTRVLHSVAWTGEADQVLRQIGERASQVGKDGKAAPINLPFVTLWTWLQLAQDGWISLTRNLATKSFISRGAGQQPFGYMGDKVDVQSLTDTAARWIDGPLTHFVQKFGVPFTSIERLRELARARRLFACERSTVQLFPWGAIADAQLPYVVAPGELATLLAGKELFPGLGPVVRVVDAGDNFAELMTAPTAAAGGLFSLVCQLSLQTVPGARDPLVYLNFARRRWASALDTNPIGMTRIGGFVFSDARPHTAFRFDLDYEREQGWIANPAYQELELALGLMPGYGDARIVNYPHHGSARALVMCKPGVATDKSSRLHVGVPVADQLAAYRRVLEILSPVGFIPFAEHEEVKGSNKGPERISVLRAPLILSRLLGDSMDNLDEDDEHGLELDQRIVELTKRSLSDWFGRDRPALDRQYANVGALVADLVHKSGLVMDPQRRKLYVLVQSPAEKPWVEAVVRLMLGDTVGLLVGEIPAGVHGPRRQLAGAGASDAERMRERTEIWRRFARTHELDEHSMVLVQADDWYATGGKNYPDDTINKAACRRALAAECGAVVQYLLPARAHKLENYLMRLQAAVLDLVYGHSGCVLGMPAAVASCFPIDGTRPSHLVAVGSVNVEMGRRKGTVLAAVRYDTALGRPQIRLAHVEAEPVSTEWMTFEEGLRYVARRPFLETGKGAQSAALFQRFLAEVLDDTARVDSHAVVFIDSTRIAGWWKRLGDKGARYGSQQMDADSGVRGAWAGLRLIRVREQAPTMVNIRKDGPPLPTGDKLEVATTVRRLYTVAGADAPTYWSYGPPGQQKRGTSCYRPMLLPDRSRLATVEFQPDYGQHHTPKGTEFVILQAQQHDDHHALARFAERLRLGVVQARGDIWVKVPAPLFVLSKLADYMGY